MARGVVTRGRVRRVQTGRHGVWGGNGGEEDRGHELTYSEERLVVFSHLFTGVCWRGGGRGVESEDLVKDIGG
jgi:hypothetical protein